ncbi:hypothetical protein B0O99DRAFT_609667 [Bisporella sp. PMI_857]|nr:hypothetical protein B0O99DRAFT_609667 [Bisporella sp. PMI_857]
MACRSLSRSCSHISTPAFSSTARGFLQLASQRHLHTLPIPDFLIPSITSTYNHHGRNLIPKSSIKCQYAISRSFTASSARRETRAIVNPRQDDDGMDMTIEITPRASNRLREIMAKDKNPDLALRIQVESGGCHGFQYLMSLTTLPPLNSSGAVQEPPPGEKAKELDEDDTVFTTDDGSTAKVVMDGPSLELLKGSKVDFTMELIGSQFKIVDNPLATSSCGCGTSFDIKV